MQNLEKQMSTKNNNKRVNILPSLLSDSTDTSMIYNCSDWEITCLLEISYKQLHEKNDVENIEQYKKIILKNFFYFVYQK